MKSPGIKKKEEEEGEEEESRGETGRESLRDELL